MTFRSKYKSAPVKAVIVSASNCSGKSYTLRQLSKDDYFKDVQIFEMDWLKYTRKPSRDEQLPIAWQKFNQWLENEKVAEAILLDELRSNIETSEPKIQLVKLKFVELMTTSERFVTVLPGSMRHNPEGIRFVELLEECFEKRIVHTAIIPHRLRFFLNLSHRHRLLKFHRLKIALAERALLISKKAEFDDVIEVPFRATREDFFVDIFKKYFNPPAACSSHG